MRKKKFQSSLEYVVLFCVIIAAILIGQTFLKRRAQGYIKEQASSLANEGWSFSHSQERMESQLKTDQISDDQVNTDAKYASFLSEKSKITIQDLKKNNVYSKEDRYGGRALSTRQTSTDALTQEHYDFEEYNTKQFGDYKLE